MLSLDSVVFDTTGLTPASDAASVPAQCDVRAWRTAEGDDVRLCYCRQTPDLPPTLASLEDLRRLYRARATANEQAVIEISTVSVAHHTAIRTILRARQGVVSVYSGWLTLPWRDFSYRIQVQSEEQGVTGLREAMVLAQLIARKQVKVKPDQLTGAPPAEGAGLPLEGWAEDPYDPTLQGPLVCNRSEGEYYDAQFPEHPLARVRRVLQQVTDTLTLADALKSAPGFPLPE